MPMVDGKKYAYTKEGMKQAEKARNKKKKDKKGSACGQGSLTGSCYNA